MSRSDRKWRRISIAGRFGAYGLCSRSSAARWAARRRIFVNNQVIPGRAMKLGGFVVVSLFSLLPRPGYPQRGERIQIGAQPRIVIGAQIDGTEEELAWVVSAAKLSSGRIAIADRGLHQIRVYDQQGRLLGKSGQRGEGPGDFGVIERLWIGRGDTVFVFDYLLQRVQLFLPNGRFARAWPTFDHSGSLHALGGYSDGSVLFESRIPGAAVRETGVRPYQMRLIRARPNGTRVDTLGTFFGGETLVLMRDGRVTGSSHVPLGRYAHAIPAGAKTYYLDGSSNEVVAIDSSTRSFALDAEETRVSAAERENRIRDFVESLANMSPSFIADVRRALSRDLDRPPPLFDSLLVDRGGAVWARAVRRPAPETSTWFVATDGRESFRVDLPAKWQLLDVGADYVLIADHDDAGRTTVKEFPITRR